MKHSASTNHLNIVWHDLVWHVLASEDIARWADDNGVDSDAFTVDEVLAAVQAQRLIKKQKKGTMVAQPGKFDVFVASVDRFLVAVLVEYSLPIEVAMMLQIVLLSQACVMSLLAVKAALRGHRLCCAQGR